MIKQLFKLTILLLLPIGLLQCTPKQEKEEGIFQFDGELLPNQKLEPPKLSKAVVQHTKATNIVEEKEHIELRAKEQRIKLGAYDPFYQFLVEKLKRIEDGSYRYGNIINKPDTANNNCTALHYAAKLQNPEIIRILLELEAKVDIKNSKGETPLDWAVIQVEQPNLESIQRLLSKTTPAVINSTSYEHGRTLLFQAIWGCKETTALALLNHPYIEVQTCETLLEFTPLHGAVYWGFEKIVQKLLEKGADIDRKDKNHQTPLEIARQYGYPNIIKLLKATSKNDQCHTRGW